MKKENRKETCPETYKNPTIDIHPGDCKLSIREFIKKYPDDWNQRLDSLHQKKPDHWFLDKAVNEVIKAGEGLDREIREHQLEKLNEAMSSLDRAGLALFAVNHDCVRPASETLGQAKNQLKEAMAKFEAED